MEIGQPPVGAQEGVLRDVFGFVGIVRQPVSEPHDGPAVAVDELAECLIRPGASRIDEVDVAYEQHGSQAGALDSTRVPSRSK